MAAPLTFHAAVERWIGAEPLIRSAVLFGSLARPGGGRAGGDAWSDVDLHVGTPAPAELEGIDWAHALSGESYRFQVVRAATGGVRKATVVFAHGQIDLVIVPLRKLRALRTALAGGRHLRPGIWRDTLNEFQVCLRSRYRFLKGEREWGAFYAQVAKELPGVRVEDSQAIALAMAALADLLWVFQKLERGEYVAAQHRLHRFVGETNLRLMRELRLRQGDPLPSFGLGRRFEVQLPPDQLRWVRIDAGLNSAELRGAAWNSYEGLAHLMHALVPAWNVPDGARALLAPFRPGGAD